MDNAIFEMKKKKKFQKIDGEMKLFLSQIVESNL